jgi:acetyl-CoA synthetase (ADP-forming)
VESKVSVIDRAIKEERRSLSEHESKGLLKSFGIPVTREIEVSRREDLGEAIRVVGLPLVMKVSSHLATHKFERGYVRVDIRSMEEARQAFDEVMTAAEAIGGRVLVQEMLRGKRELALGLIRDRQFGPCVMFGIGGIFTEFLNDVAFRVAPLEKRDALEMMYEIRSHGILGEVRGLPAADVERLAEILVRLGEIGLEESRIQEIDLNPVILVGNDPVAADALVVLIDTPDEPYR